MYFFPLVVQTGGTACILPGKQALPGPGWAPQQMRGFCLRSGSPAWLALPFDTGHPVVGELNLFKTRGKKRNQTQSSEVAWISRNQFSTFYWNCKALSQHHSLRLGQSTRKEEQKQHQSHDQERSERSHFLLTNPSQAEPPTSSGVHSVPMHLAIQILPKRDNH